MHTVQLGANCLPGTECQAWNEINAAITEEQESARGSHQGETPGIFIVLSGFAATDLSVRFRDARQGGGAYGKTAAVRPFLFSSFDRSVFSSFYTDAPAARRSRTTGA